MSYLVLARKYRPQRFDTVVDQDHITRTLSNAILGGRVAHAILFTGPRGTGKTTVARILAKSMNCTEGPTPAPCEVCQSCREVTEGRAVDVFEIDGASNNSVDQVRELRDNVKYMPAHSAYKIYIIDEVHMLSTPAFNALLKTLEEPPSHVMFIFATTEPHKIPLTILSRCQRHDFKRIKWQSIAKHMRELCRLEGFHISDDSLTLIAGEAGGSMRDALSLLDQVMACTRSEASDPEVVELLGVIDRETIFNFSGALLDGDAHLVLQIVDELHQRGRDLKRFYYDLVAHFRNLLVVKMSDQPERLVDLPTHEIQRMTDQAAPVSATHLSQLFDMLFREEPAVKLSFQTRIALEMACFRLLEAKQALSIETLIGQLSALRGELADTPPAGPAPAVERQGPPSSTGTATPENRSRKAGSSRAESADTRSAGVQENLRSAWEAVQSGIPAEQSLLAAILSKCRLKQPDKNHLLIEVTGNAFNLSMIQKDKNLEIIRRVCKDVFGREMEVDVRATSEHPLDNAASKKETNKLKSDALSHPLVAEALDIFDGKIVGVRILKEDDS